MKPKNLRLLQQAKDELGITTWKEFFEMYSRLIDSWLRRRRLQIHDIEDIRQDVLTVIIRELPNLEYNGRAEAFRAWVRQATANRLRQFWRESTRRKNQINLSQIAERAGQLEAPDSPLTRNWSFEHDMTVVSKLLDRIEPNFQARTIDAFRRVALAQEDEKLVAEDLGMTVNAVRIAQSRVLKTIRQLVIK